MVSDLTRLADAAARKEIELTGLPTFVHYELSYAKAAELADRLGARKDLVLIGIALIDLKLGEAFHKKRLADHVQMSAAASEELLQGKITEDDLLGVLNSIRAHHGGEAFGSLESEICANADCYRFLHPAGVLHYVGTLGARGLAPAALLDQAEDKLKEKWAIVSLPAARQELEPFFAQFSELFAVARQALPPRADSASSAE
jgi:hypothetical protein